jgi:sortase A
VPSYSGGSSGISGGLGGAGALVGVSIPAGARSAPRELRAAEAAVHIPAFAGRGGVGSIGAVLALLAIASLTSAAAWFTARQLRRRRSASHGRLDGSLFVRVGGLTVMWLGVVAAGVALVMFALGPTLQEREQRALVASYRTTVSNAANELQGLPGATESDKAPESGSPVGIVEIGALRTQDVVVEGVAAEQTSRAPGHVPGTAGLGQPGNSVIVARRQSFGGAFSGLDRLRAGDNIVVTTTQGQSVYVVREVHSVKADDALYAPSDDDRLTLVTSASSLPWDTSRAVEVVARLSGRPFAPTPQQGRSVHATGTQGDSSSTPSVVLALLVLAGAIAGSIALYGRLRARSAYILSVAPLVALTLIAGETIARLLPAWS